MPEIAFHRIGDGGAPVVFLHGLMGRGRNFTSVARALTGRYHSILVDLPNHGDSAWTDHFDFVELADTIADFLRREVQDGPAAVVGHSLGGKVAMLVALRHRELVERLAVVDIAPAESATADNFQHLLGSLRAINLSEVHSRGDAEAQLARRVDDERVRQFLLQNLRPLGGGRYDWQPNLDMLYGALGDIRGWPAVSEPPYEGRCVWILGEHSDYTDPEDERRMRALFPHVNRVVMRDAGHWVHADQPSGFISVLEFFLGLGRPGQ